MIVLIMSLVLLVVVAIEVLVLDSSPSGTRLQLMVTRREIFSVRRMKACLAESASAGAPIIGLFGLKWHHDLPWQQYVQRVGSISANLRHLTLSCP